MTAYEYLEVGLSNLSNSIALVSLSIAVLSGYCLVAYTVGAKLTRAQVSALNLNYIIWCSYLSFSGGTSLANGFRRINTAQEILGEQAAIVPYSIQMYSLLCILLTTTSLWFMWSVRHPKTE
jgi:hypothetical protein